MKILIVEDEPLLLELIENAFNDRRHNVRGFVSPTTALETLPTWRPDVLLCDLDVAGGHTQDLAWVIAHAQSGPAPRTRIVLMSIDPHRLALFFRGADDVLLKPFTTNELTAVVESLG